MPTVLTACFSVLFVALLSSRCFSESKGSDPPSQTFASPSSHILSFTMARDKRWPVGWFFFLLELHMSILIALAGLSGSQMVDSRSNNVWLLIWMLAAAVTAILVLTIHEICLCCGRLSPGWTLSWYLLISLVWVTVVIVFAFSEMDPTYRGDCVTYKPTIGEYRNRTSCFIYTIDLALMIVVTICWYVPLNFLSLSKQMKHESLYTFYF